MSAAQISSGGWTGSAFSDDEEDSESYGTQTDSDDSDDDVPLAQRLPGALRVQKSMRVEERAKKELIRRETRATTTSQSASPPANLKPLEVGQLTRKLLELNTNTSRSQASSYASPSTPLTNGDVRRRAQSTSRPERPEFPEASSMPVTRQPTTARPHGKPPRSQSRPSSPTHKNTQVTSPLPASGTFSPQSRTFTENPPPTAQRVSEDGQLLLASQKNILPSVRARAMSLHNSGPRKLHRTQTSADRNIPPTPTIPSRALAEPQETVSGDVIQQRIFIGDMQRFNTVEIGPRTSAGTVIKLVEAQGELNCPAAGEPGGWMLWEVSNDFGMERPLREYELPMEVYASWNSNMRLNAFIIRKTPLAFLLARSSLPSSSPTYGGYVQWEVKRGKWSKRWMELKEHSIWLSKRDTGKDSTFLCSLSNFDCYRVSPLHKAPKPFVFAVKSTDNITLFENPADYLHIFSCDNAQGTQWMERILLARSYVLYKERTVLFGAQPPTQNPLVSPITPSLRGRDKSFSSRAAPLVQVPSGSPATVTTHTTNNVFQSGSLLAKVS